MRRWYVWAPVSTALFAVLIWRTRPWEEGDIIARMDPWVLGLAISLDAVVLVAWGIRSQRLMRAVGWTLSVIELIPVTAFANTVSSLTPASSGEVFRAMVLRRLYRVPYDRSAAVILVERFYAMWLMAVSAAAAAVGTLIPAALWFAIAAWATGAIALFLPSILYAGGMRPGRILAPLGPSGRDHPSRWRRLVGYLVSVDDHLHAILTSPRRAIHFVGSTAAIFVVFTAQLWLLLDALGSTVQPVGVWSVYGIATIAGVVSALPFGLGATDIVIVIGLGILGVAPPTATAATLMLRFVSTLPIGIVGTISWISLSRRPEAGAYGLPTGREHERSE